MRKTTSVPSHLRASRRGLVAIDVAILPPEPVAGLARELNAAIQTRGSADGLVLDATHLPHVTLTQQFVRDDDLEEVLERVGGVLRSVPPLTLRVTGGAKGGSSVW